MVQPCCDNTYVKYQSAPHVVDLPKVRALHGETATVETRTEKDTDWAEWIFKRHGHYPRDTWVFVNGTESRLCTCECHTHGSNIMH
jgi:hypothetical protein